MADYTKPVIFKLGNEEYGIDIKIVNGIEWYQQIIPVPNSKSYIIGLMNLRGEVVPVYSLRKKFNMPPAAVRQMNMIVVRIKDMLIAFDVDSVSDIHDFSSASVTKLPAIVQTEDTKYFDRVARYENRLIVLIDVEKLLSDEELEEARNIKDQMKK